MCAADTVGEVCGRYVSSSKPEAIAEFFGAVAEGEPLSPNYNVAPTNDVYAIVAASDGARRVQTYRWGLVPSWAKDVRIGSKMINARAETLGEKPSFKGLFRTHRLLVPMDGFYEWQQGTGLTAAGKPGLPHGVEVQILDHAFAERRKARGETTDWFGTNGDVFPVGVKMKPFPPLSPDGSRSFPRKHLARGHGEWNHYYIRAINGEVRLWVNGEEVSGGTGIEPAKGYICLESEGSPIIFRKLRVRELP